MQIRISFSTNHYLYYAGQGTIVISLNGKTSTTGPQSVGRVLHFAKTKDVLAFEVSERLFKASHSIKLGRTQTFTRIIVFLVWLILPFGVANLCLQIVVVLDFKILDSFPERPLSVTAIVLEEFDT